MQSASIEFLPCRYGGGYSASISGFWGNHDVEGWVTGAYDNLRGIVLEPEPECESAPKRDPAADRVQRIDMTVEILFGVGSRSAPIGIPPQSLVSKLFQ